MDVQAYRPNSRRFQNHLWIYLTAIGKNTMECIVIVIIFLFIDSHRKTKGKCLAKSETKLNVHYWDS